MLTSSEILQRTNAEGGITLLNMCEVTHEIGYIVGGAGPSSIVPCNDVRALSQALNNLTNAGYTLVGTWFNDGHIHVDAVEWVESREEALRLGKERQEVAIWDCAEGKEVETLWNS